MERSGRVQVPIQLSDPTYTRRFSSIFSLTESGRLEMALMFSTGYHGRYSVLFVLVDILDKPAR